MLKTVNTSLLLCLIILCLFILSSCIQNKPSENAKDFKYSIKSKDDFDQFAGKPLYQTLNQVKSVKVVYDIDNNKLYYINSNKFLLHFDFCKESLSYPWNQYIFNLKNFANNNKRDYYLATINYYESSKTYCLDFSAADNLNVSQIAKLLNLCKNSSYFGDSLKLFVNNTFLVNQIIEIKSSKIKYLTPNEVYKNQLYQLLHNGLAFGQLIFTDTLEKIIHQIRPYHIIVTKGSPLSIPPCAGILTETFQTPLSHIQVLCNSRKTPSACLKDLWQRTDIKKLQGQWVKMKVTDQDVIIEESTQEEIMQQHQKKVSQLIVLKSNLTETSLISIDKMGLHCINSIGSKAANFGELYKIHQKNQDFLVPEGAFSIPFYFYDQHVSNPNIKNEISELLSNNIYSKNTDSLAIKLKKIRNIIKHIPISKELLKIVESKIKTNSIGNSYRFRSSSNAEDLESFSGAGLYNSKTGILNDTSKTIEEAIKEVWSSTWNLRAFQERSWYLIDQKSVKMGILVHRNFPDEFCNGVVVTKNLYRPNFTGFTVNIQIGEESVVSPNSKYNCEQIIIEDANEITSSNKSITATYINYSSLNNNLPILNKKQLSILFKSIESIKKQYYNITNSKVAYNNNALDLEFKFEKNGLLYIKQVRPYQ